MNKINEKQFQNIGAKALEMCDGIKCNKSDYIEGLKMVVSDIESAQHVAEEELENEGE